MRSNLLLRAPDADGGGVTTLDERRLVAWGLEPCVWRPTL
jgi:hypothetical protein